MRALWSALIIALLLSGCTESTDTDDAGHAGADGADGQPGEGGATVDVAGPLSDPWHLDGAGAVLVGFVAVTSDHYFEFDVPKSGPVTVTSTWDCLSPACELRLSLWDGDAYTHQVSGSGTLEIAADLDAGSYAAVMFPEIGGSAAVRAEGTFEIVMGSPSD